LKKPVRAGDKKKGPMLRAKKDEQKVLSPSFSIPRKKHHPATAGTRFLAREILTGSQALSDPELNLQAHGGGAKGKWKSAGGFAAGFLGGGGGEAQNPGRVDDDRYDMGYIVVFDIGDADSFSEVRTIPNQTLTLTPTLTLTLTLSLTSEAPDLTLFFS